MAKHVDAYQSLPSFTLFNDLFELFDASESYDEDASYDVCVLQFKQDIPVLHWSIYLQSQSDDEDGGPVYDVWYHEDVGRWRRKESQANKVTHMSSVWRGADGRSHASGGYHGGTVLGTIEDLGEFQSVVRSTSLPGYNENCQTWVEAVVRRAVNRGLLGSDALRTLRQVPRR